MDSLKIHKKSVSDGAFKKGSKSGKSVGTNANFKGVGAISSQADDWVAGLKSITAKIKVPIWHEALGMNPIQDQDKSFEENAKLTLLNIYKRKGIDQALRLAFGEEKDYLSNISPDKIDDEMAKIKAGKYL